MRYTYVIDSYNTILDDELILEKSFNIVSDIIKSIDTFIKKIVENFNRLMEKTKLEKEIKRLEKLPKDTKIKMGVDSKEAMSTYNDIMNNYGKFMKNPTKENYEKMKSANDVARKKRKKIVLTTAVAVPVSTVLGYLYLLRRKNDFKNYFLSKNVDKMDRIVTDWNNRATEANRRTKEKVKNLNMYSEEDRKKALYYGSTYSDAFKRASKDVESDYKEYLEVQKGLKESEYFRLVLYKDIMKSIKSVGTYVKDTVVLGSKAIKNKIRMSDDELKKRTNEVEDKYNYLQKSLDTSKLDNDLKRLSNSVN